MEDHGGAVIHPVVDRGHHIGAGGYTPKELRPVETPWSSRLLAGTEVFWQDQ